MIFFVLAGRHVVIYIYIYILSVDMKKIEELACHFPFLWCTVIEAIVCMWFLFLILGPAALGGIFILLLATPIGAYCNKKLNDYQNSLLENKDIRISVVQEVCIYIYIYICIYLYINTYIYI
jgi:hypothetical protein